jgi:hypothetical protein
MTFPVFASGDVLNASDMNAVGLWLVKTQTIGSGVASVTITSCFSAQYDNYLISFSDMTASASGVLYGKLTVGTTPQTNGWTGNTFFIVNGAAGGLGNATITNAAFFELGSITSTAGYKNASTCNLQAPFLTTQARSQYSNADDNYFRFSATQLANTTSYDGLQISPSSGTITGGTIRVYGYRN